MTAKVTSSASLSLGAIPTAGRHGARWGACCSRSSMVTYSAVARVSRSASTGPPGSTLGLNADHGHPPLIPHPTATPWNQSSSRLHGTSSGVSYQHPMLLGLALAAFAAASRDPAPAAGRGPGANYQSPSQPAISTACRASLTCSNRCSILQHMVLTKGAYPTTDSGQPRARPGD